MAVIHLAGHRSISVINGAARNGTSNTSRATAPPACTTSSPAFVVVAQATNTIYVANYNAGYISVVNGATCNAASLSGCGHAMAMTAI